MSAAALYVYAIVPDIDRPVWGAIGLDGVPVWSVVESGLAALVHDAPAAAYQGPDEQVQEWLLDHARVVEAAWEAAGTVLPLAFNVLVKSASDEPAEARLRSWLKTTAGTLAERLEALRDRVELKIVLGVDPSACVAGDAETVRLRADLQTKPAGLRRLLERKSEQLARDAAEQLADRLYPVYRRRIAALVEDIVEQRRTRPADGTVPILSGAVLIQRRHVNALGAELAACQAEEAALRIRYLGPWPPYSFAQFEAPGEGAHVEMPAGGDHASEPS